MKANKPVEKKRTGRPSDTKIFLMIAAGTVAVLVFFFWFSPPAKFAGKDCGSMSGCFNDAVKKCEPATFYLHVYAGSDKLYDLYSTVRGWIGDKCVVTYKKSSPESVSQYSCAYSPEFLTQYDQKTPVERDANCVSR